MEIKILTTQGCAACDSFTKITQQAINELGLDFQLVIADKITDILSYRVMNLPALIINEKVVVYGKHFSLPEMKELLIKYCNIEKE